MELSKLNQIRPSLYEASNTSFDNSSCTKNISHFNVRSILKRHNASQSMKHNHVLTEEQKCRIIELSRENPQNYDPTLNQWTCAALVKIIKEESIEENAYHHLYDRIHRFLKSTSLLHKVTT